MIIQTYQYYEAGTINPFYFSKVLYVIFDEAHYFLEDASFNSETNLWAEWIKTFYTTPVNSETPICVFMTATPEPLRAFSLRYMEKNGFHQTPFSENFGTHMGDFTILNQRYNVQKGILV